MSNSTTERDILADILNGPHTGAIRGLDELRKLIHVTTPKKDSMTALLRPKSRSVGAKKKKKKQAKRKTTHYLNEDVFEDLGEAKRIIKDFLPAGSKTIATKSRIVESAIKVLLGEFDEKGKESYLVKELLKKKDQKTK
nr:hypothetical protein [Desulfobulbaceae bacterium]